jgi:hypothetical protein
MKFVIYVWPLFQPIDALSVGATIPTVPPLHQASNTPSKAGQGPHAQLNSNSNSNSNPYPNPNHNQASSKATEAKGLAGWDHVYGACFQAEFCTRGCLGFAHLLASSEQAFDKMAFLSGRWTL